jgi:hypothetical protein
MTRLAERAVFGTAQLVSGLLTIVGILGLLKTGFSGFTDSEGVAFLGMTVSPLTNCIHLAAGLIGIAMATRLDKAMRYLLVIGCAGIVFALLEFVLGDSGSDIFGRDARMAIAELMVAAGSLGVWFWARSTAPAGVAPVRDVEA